MVIGRGFLLVLAIACKNVLTQEYVNGECYISGVPTRCEPVRMSFSLGQSANASSTCGAVPTPFCVRSVSLGRISSDCSGDNVCDANDPANAHPATYLTDFPLLDMWWQSENSLSIDNEVVIDIPLLTLAEIEVISIDFKTIKAAGFRLEKSTDFGQTYQPYHYFAISCENLFGIDPETELTPSNEATPLCQTIQKPPTPGGISFFPAIDRPSANDSTPGYSETLYRFATATNIRVILDQHHALDLADEDPGYYYALEDINVIGSCQCYGHASKCIQNDETGAYECVCSHNTKGKYCDQCQDLYNDVPWRRADGNNSFECKMCNCNNHSDECVFNETAYAQTGRGGVCLNCDGNTYGIQCETCAPFYYPRPDRNQTDSDICEECRCSLLGVVNDGECVKEGDGVLQPGDCYCKANVMGSKCDMCKLGYYNLSAENPDGCEACNCNVNGSFSQECNNITGACECKPNLTGAQCDRCRQNYYQPDPNLGCIPCNCNLGGSTSLQCNRTTGECSCLPGVTGKTCNETIAGYFFPTIDHLRLEGESAISIPPSPLILPSGEGELFTGTGYYSAEDGDSISNFGILVLPVSGTYEVLFRYNLMEALVWDTVTLTISVGTEEGTGAANCGDGTELPVGDSSFQYLTWTMGTGLTISRNFCFRAGRSYTFILSELVSGLASSPVLDIDSLVVIPINAPTLAVFGDNQLTSDYSTCVDAWRRVSTISSAELICERITFTFFTAINGGTLPCDCDPDGSMPGTVCEPFGGQCVCLPGVRGRRCDECSPGTFNFSPTGCTNCSCNSTGSRSNLCHPVDGTCDCLPNVAGPDCSACEPNFWGLTADIGCIACSCNSIGSRSLQCDQITGQCICKPGVVGAQCDECGDAHYGFSSSGCSPCDCNQAGSLGQDCEEVIGQCTCKSNTRRRDCSVCIPGTFNLQANNPYGCQPCFCSGLDTTCSAALGFVASNISTDFDSDPPNLQGWRIVTTNFTTHPDPDSVVTTIPFSSGLTLLPNSGAFLQAPQQYLGNRLSSYLQFITISLESQSNVTAESVSQFDIILTGRSLELGTKFSSDDADVFQVQFNNETFDWFHVATNQRASSHNLQTVLLFLENIYITASFNSTIILSKIRLDTVEETADSDDPSMVTWVEQCDCPDGYSGLSCEECSVGYTRYPSGQCEPCQCNGFSDTCDMDTGVCIGCTGSTTGDFCDQCLPGTYGDPTQGIPCLPCPCPLTMPPGQFALECMLTESNTIVCLNCSEGHMGDQCESCREGYFGDPTGENGTVRGCSDCLCNGNIDINVPGSCDVTTGVCVKCVNNTAGDMCERCADGYFGDAIIAKNCSECDCNSTGSIINVTCDHQTGQCMCKPNVEGRRCERCSPGHYGFNSGLGCTLCNCNLYGSVHSQCHAETGQCTCRPGVTGMHCDQCITGYSMLSENGCQECNCSEINSIRCDDSGMCVCRTGSTGSDCGDCIDNYFQEPHGCTECPPCYQELQSTASDTYTLLEETESDLFKLIVQLSPYEPRLNARKDEVERIADLVQMHSQQYDMLQMQVAYLTTKITETMLQQLLQLEERIMILERVSTPVFIQALASEELMNRIIKEFLVAQQAIDILGDFHIPNITLSVSNINSSHTISMEVLQSLTSQAELLTTQANEISDLVLELQHIASMSLARVEDIDILSENTEELTISLYHNLTYIQQYVNSLTQRLRYFEMSLMEINIRIENLRNDIPDIPSADTLGTLHANLSTTLDTITDIEGQLTEKQSELYLLQDTLADYSVTVDSLTRNLSRHKNETASFEEYAQRSINITTNAIDNVKQKLSEAVEVLENLQSYKNDTFEVERRANEALESVTQIRETADYAIDTTTEIQQNVSALLDIVQEAMDKANNAENITKIAQMAISGVGTGALISNISSSLRDIESSRDETLDLKMEAESYQETLANLEDSITTTEELVRNSSALVGKSDELITQANSSVSAVEKALSDLNSLNSSALQEALGTLDLALSSLESEISARDLVKWHSMLNQSLHVQKEKRRDLEQRLVSMQAEVDHLKYLESMLPHDCDRNL